jgi:His/Glu/Gln/Arg/opine family amino acid ABC transporter permease subunit
VIEVLTENLDDYSSGLWVTTRLVLGSFVLALALGTLIAIARAQPVKPVRWLATVYTEVFRGVPLLVLLFISFAGVRRGGVAIDAWTAGMLSLGVYTSAYVAEALRSGMSAVGAGQREAGLSLGFSEASVMRRIVLPQAFRTVIPPLGSITIAMIKNSAIVGASIVALDDILKEARIVNSNTFQTHEAFFWGAVGYLLLTVTVTIVFRTLETRFAVRR